MNEIDNANPAADSTARYTCAADMFPAWRQDVLYGDPPVLYRAGDGELARIEIGPGMVTLLGGAPGAGKTAFIMQLVVDAMRLNPSLRALVCNVEMSPGSLLNRQLARLSGINARTIRMRALGEEHAERINACLDVLEPLMDRLAFLEPPYSLENVVDTWKQMGKPGLVVLDYIQRFTAPTDSPDQRGNVDALMDYVRQLADRSVAVVLVAAISRQKDSSGRTGYDANSLNLASFRGSSELEFGGNEAFILAPGGTPGEVLLKHLKSRDGEMQDMWLAFDGAHQSFKPMEHPPEQPSPKKKRRGRQGRDTDPGLEGGDVEALREAWGEHAGSGHWFDSEDVTFEDLTGRGDSGQEDDDE